MSSPVRVRSKDFPQLAKMVTGQAVTVTLKGRKGKTLMDGGQEIVEIDVLEVNTSKNGRMGQAQMIQGIQATVSKILANAEQVNTPRP